MIRFANGDLALFVDTDDILSRISQLLNVSDDVRIYFFAGTNYGDARGVGRNGGGANQPFCFF